MGTLNEKLEYLSQTKEYIKEAIISKGQDVSSSDTFRSYASKIAAIENGDIITATNTTGSFISATEKVWVSPMSVETQNFTVVGNPTINNKIISNFSDSNYITTGSTQFAPIVSEPWEICISFTTGSDVTGANRTLIESNGFRIGIDFDGHAEIGLSDGTNSDGLTLSNVVLNSNTTYSLVAILDGGDLYLELYPGSGGLPIASSDKTTSLTSSIVSSSAVFGVAYFYALYGVGPSNVFDGAIDLRHFYFVIMDPTTYDTTFEWNPYSESSSSYSIIPSKLVTSTCFTAVAQTSIANNASGSVKTILDGNGTYAPTLGTKVITTNNTYSASTDDLYGYSSVTVNVEDIPAIAEELMLVNDGAVTFTLTVSPTDATSVITSTTNSVILTPSSSSGGVSVYSISANPLKTYNYSVSKTGYDTETGTIVGGTSTKTVTLNEEGHASQGESDGGRDPKDVEIEDW